MDGISVFFLIGIGVAVLSAILGIRLKRRRHDRIVSGMFGFLFILSLVIFVISLSIGGWTGMGYGFIAISVFIGSFAGLMVTALINPHKHLRE